MSNQAVRRPLLPQSRTARIGILVGIPVLCVLLAVLLRLTYVHMFLPDDSWPSYDAQVLGTRLVRQGSADSGYGGYVLYRVEIHASWTQDGTAREAWVPTVKTGSGYTWLALWASQQGKHCIVRQSPRNPSARLAFFSSNH